jgi:pimeloyl-ACP methyl ester carboxylesterase
MVRLTRTLAGRLLRPVAVAVVVVAACLTAPAVAEGGAPPAAGAAGVDWAQPGPYAVGVEVTVTHTLYYPTDLGRGGAKHPVVVWGNGTFAFPAVYGGLLRHWASHGFVVAAANATQSGTGLQIRLGIDLLAHRNQNPFSRFYGKIDVGHVAAAGHSQGGQGAINASVDPRVDTTIPIQPGPLASSSSLHGPALFLAGQHDDLVPPALVEQFYEAAEHVVAIYGELAGAGHFTPMGDAGGFRGPMTAWLRFHLMGDETARGEFFGPACSVCTSNAWSQLERNAAALQVPGPGAP